MSLIQELKRRNVIRVAIAYLAAAWLVLQVADTVIPFVGLEESVGRIVLIREMVGWSEKRLNALEFDPKLPE